MTKCSENLGGMAPPGYAYGIGGQKTNVTLLTREIIYRSGLLYF